MTIGTKELLHKDAYKAAVYGLLIHMIVSAAKDTKCKSRNPDVRATTIEKGARDLREFRNWPIFQAAMDCGMTFPTPTQVQRFVDKSVKIPRGYHKVRKLYLRKIFTKRYNVKCERCGESFIAKRTKTRFCGRRCKQLSWLDKKNGDRIDRRSKTENQRTSGKKRACQNDSNGLQCVSNGDKSDNQGLVDEKKTV